MTRAWCYSSLLGLKVHTVCAYTTFLPLVISFQGTNAMKVVLLIFLMHWTNPLSSFLQDFLHAFLSFKFLKCLQSSSLLEVSFGTEIAHLFMFLIGYSYLVILLVQWLLVGCLCVTSSYWNSWSSNDNTVECNCAKCSQPIINYPLLNHSYYRHNNNL